MAALLALLSAIGFGISDFSGGVAARRAGAVAVVLVSNTLSLVLAAVVAGLLPGSTLRAADLAWGAGAGAVGVVGVVLLYRGLALGPMAVVAPLTAVLSAIVPVIVGTVLGERPGTVAIIGVILAIPAVVLISRDASPATADRPRLTTAGLVAALSAGLSFGVFYVLLAQTGPDGGAWPLVSQRAASVLLLVPIAAVLWRRGTLRIQTLRGARSLALVAGATDFAANLAYVSATHRGLLALVAVVSSLYPGATVLLARTVLHERLTRRQLAGLGLAAIAVTLIALR